MGILKKRAFESIVNQIVNDLMRLYNMNEGERAKFLKEKYRLNRRKYLDFNSVVKAVIDDQLLRLRLALTDIEDIMKKEIPSNFEMVIQLKRKNQSCIAYLNGGEDSSKRYKSCVDAIIELLSRNNLFKKTLYIAIEKGKELDILNWEHGSPSISHGITYEKLIDLLKSIGWKIKEIEKVDTNVNDIIILSYQSNSQ